MVGLSRGIDGLGPCFAGLVLLGAGGLSADAQSYVCAQRPAGSYPAGRNDPAGVIEAVQDWSLVQELRTNARFEFDFVSEGEVTLTNRATGDISQWRTPKPAIGGMIRRVQQIADRPMGERFQPRDADPSLPVLNIDGRSQWRAQPVEILDVTFTSVKLDPFGGRAVASGSRYTCMQEDDLRDLKVALPDGVECKMPPRATMSEDPFGERVYVCGSGG